MKNRFTPFFLQGLAAGVAAVLAQQAQGQVIYNNSGSDGGTATQVGDFNYTATSGSETIEVGNQVLLGDLGSSYTISSLQFQFDLNAGTSGLTSPSGTELATVNFYTSTGAPGNTTPGTFDGSASIPIGADLGTHFTSTSPFSQNSEDVSATVSGLSITVPGNGNFTWTVAFSGLTTGEQAGLSIFNGPTSLNGNGTAVPTPSVGANYNDAWQNTGSGWTLLQNAPPNSTGNPGLQFGAIINGTAVVPEPSTIALGVIGACSFLMRRRKS